MKYPIAFFLANGFTTVLPNEEATDHGIRQDILKRATSWGPGICQPQCHSRAFNTHAVSYQNITTLKVLLAKSRLAHLSRTGINGRGL